jgi:hypothetical protein
MSALGGATKVVDRAHPEFVIEEMRFGPSPEARPYRPLGDMAANGKNCAV